MKVTLKPYHGAPVSDETADEWAVRAITAIRDEDTTTHFCLSGNRMVLAVNDGEDIEVFDMTITRYAKVKTGV